MKHAGMRDTMEDGHTVLSRADGYPDKLPDNTRRHDRTKDKTSKKASERTSGEMRNRTSGQPRVGWRKENACPGAGPGAGRRA